MPSGSRSLADRFWPNVHPEPNSGCWLWSGSHTPYGYGVVNLKRHGFGQVGAHRLSLAMHGVEIPEGMFVLHKCDTPACVNPEHLFVGTPADNTADMMRKGRRVAPKKGYKHRKRRVRSGACDRGHAFSPENTYWTATGTRSCRICRAMLARRFRTKHRRQAEAVPGVAAVSSPGQGCALAATSTPGEAAVPLITFQRPDPSPALLAACLALLDAHDHGRNRTPAIEAIRDALAVRDD